MGHEIYSCGTCSSPLRREHINGRFFWSCPVHGECGYCPTPRKRKAQGLFFDGSELQPLGSQGLKHEKIIKRDDGSRVRITVELAVEWSCPEARWSFVVHSCEKGKRIWRTPVNHDDFSWRRLGAEERREEDNRRSLQLASSQEVEEAMMELWQKIKPSM